MERFSERLKQLRAAAGITQQRLADLAGLSIGAIREYEQHLRYPILPNAAALADALGVTLDELAGREPPARRGKKS